MLKDRLQGVKNQVEQTVRGSYRRAQQLLQEQRTASIERTGQRSDMETVGEEPPVVARMMVEIRSDGSRTIARGALKDELSGEQVTLEAQGTTPMQLAAALAKNLLTTPLAARKLAKEMLAARRTHQSLPRDDETSQ